MKWIFKLARQRVILLGATLLLILVQPLWAANDRAPFWVFQGEKATVYLLGSIHFADKTFYPLREDVEKAFNRADYLVVEADILNSDQLAVQGFILDKGMYRGNETLRDHISEETWQALLNYAKEIGLPFSEQVLAKQKPAMVVMTLSSLMLMEQGLSPDMGIDVHFLRQASDTAKPVLELEGVQQQLEMLFDLDMPDLLLQKSLGDVETGDDMVSQLVSAWKRGDEEALNTMLITQPIADAPEFKVLMEQLDFARNRQMVEKIAGYIDRGGTYFVVVGAAHLVGNQGIPSLMDKRGISFIKQ